MAKPDYSSDLQSLADRSKKLRALVADQKKEETVTTAPKKQRAASAEDSVEKISNRKTPVNATPPKPSLFETVEKLIESDKPLRLGTEEHEWSRRLAYISTRIPEDMRNLIDDLLFILKKEAKKDLSREPTLQDLACEAWSDLLAKYNGRLSS